MSLFDREMFLKKMETLVGSNAKEFGQVLQSVDFRKLLPADLEQIEGYLYRQQWTRFDQEVEQLNVPGYYFKRLKKLGIDRSMEDVHVVDPDFEDEVFLVDYPEKPKCLVC